MAGASILGDGRVALILDVTEVVKRHANIKALAGRGERSAAVA
jgi:chemotaxis protein histidine kinase CheA